MDTPVTNILNILPEIRLKILEVSSNNSLITLAKVCKGIRKSIFDNKHLTTRYDSYYKLYSNTIDFIKHNYLHVSSPFGISIRIYARCNTTKSQILKVVPNCNKLFITENIKAGTYHFCYFIDHKNSLTSIISILKLIDHELDLNNIYADDYTRSLKYYVDI